MLRRLDEAHRVEQGACWWAKCKWHVSNDSKQTRLPFWTSGIRATGLIFNTVLYVKCQRTNFVEYEYSSTVQYLSCYLASILGLITIAYIIMTMHVFSMNMAGDDNRGVLYVASFTCPPVPLMSGHLSCTDIFTWSRGCPFIAGTTVVYLDNVIFHRIQRRLSDRNNYGCRRRPRYLIFSQFSICCCQNAFAYGALPRTPPGASSAPAGKRWSHHCRGPPQNCGPQGPETPRSATAYTRPV